MVSVTTVAKTTSTAEFKEVKGSNDPELKCFNSDNSIKVLLSVFLP